MEALTLDDTDPPPLAAYTDDPAAPPTVSERRMQASWRCDLGGVQHAWDVARPGPAHRDRTQGSHARPQWPVLLRQRKEVQEVLRTAINTV